MIPAGVSPSEIGQPLRWRVTPAGRALDDEAAIDVTQALGERALLPLSPVHLRGRFDPTGALVLDWIRRSRANADRWEGIEIPLGEEIERYRVEIADGTGRRIGIETAEPAATLSPERLDAAFGAEPAVLDIAVAQMSLAVGAGTPRRLRLSRGP